MRIVTFGPERAKPIELFKSSAASAVPLGDGTGETHVYCLHIEPGGEIGEHRAQFGQLFLVVSGSGWVEGGDGVRHDISSGEGAFFERGESHAKGSGSGMTAIMVQTHDLHPASPETTS